MRSNEKLQLQEQVSLLCERAIDLSVLKAPSIASYRLKTKFQLKSEDVDLSDTLKGLFDSLKKDSNEKVLCVDLIEHMLSLGITLDPSLLTEFFLKSLKVSSLINAYITQKVFYSMIFSDSKCEALLSSVKKHIKPRRNRSMLPNVHIQQISALSSRPFLGRYVVNTFNARGNAGKCQSVLQILNEWWDELDYKAEGFLVLNTVIDLLIKKEIAYNYADAKKILGVSGNRIMKSEYLIIFCPGILKEEILAISRTVQKINCNQSYLPAFQKVSLVKRRILIDRISPEVAQERRSKGNEVINRLSRFHKFVKLAGLSKGQL